MSIAVYIPRSRRYAREICIPPHVYLSTLIATFPSPVLIWRQTLFPNIWPLAKSTPNPRLSAMAAQARPAIWPPKPSLYDEVSWGNLPSVDDYRLAYRVWSPPNANLAPGSDTSDDDDSPSVLVRNVYDHIVPDRSKELSDEIAFDPNAQMNVAADGNGGFQGWTYEQIFPNAPPPQAPLGKEDLVIDGHGYKHEKPRYWRRDRLVRALEARGLLATGNVDVLRDRLFDYERVRQGQQQPSEGLLPRANLEDWGIRRTGQFIMEIGREKEFSPLDMYTWAILLSPYNPAYWTSRAYLFYQLGHFDLALGDAYRAFYLVEILHNVNIRTEQPGLYRCVLDAVEQHIVATGRSRDEEPVATMRRRNGINAFVPALRRTFHHIISLSLIALEAWEDYEEMDRHLTLRLIQAGAHSKPFADRAESMKIFVDRKKEQRDRSRNLWDHEKRLGSVVARRYPQAANDVDRTDAGFLAKLNDNFIGGSQGANDDRRRLLVQTTGPSSLGVTASGEIKPGVLIYAEEPSVRGHLWRESRPESRCENCKRSLTGALNHRILQDWHELDEEAKQQNQQRSCCQCCDDGYGSRVALFFCPPPPRTDVPNPPDAVEEPETCMEIARALFHNRVCGRQWRWLHRAMQPPPGRNREAAVSNGRHGTLLSLLLREVFDMTLIARRQQTAPNVLAHEIDAMLPLCGGDDVTDAPEQQRFPFGYAANIVVPFDILLALGVNIFRDLDFDTWVIQTVLRKLQLNVVPWDPSRRGPSDKIGPAVAARGETDGSRGSLEDLYIHTGFSMFNHACLDSANAIWSWDGDQPGIPNRILIRANRLVKSGEEIRVHYFPKGELPKKKRKLFGRECDCAKCS